MSLNFKNKQIVILAILAVMFFGMYSFLNFGNYKHFTWPDETANYFFINTFIKHSTFSTPDQLAEVAPGLVRPRSFNAYNGNLVPGSFLGLLLIYGLIGKIVGIGLVKYLTPILAALAGLFFYKIILKVFDEKIAFISALFFYLNPAWWYYANFSMLPNIAFLTFALMGVYWLLKIDKTIKQNNYLWVLLGSFFIALSLAIRTNEFLWILGILIALLIFYQSKIKWQYVFIFSAVCLLVFTPIFYFNQQTYGNYLSFGYLRLSSGNSLVEQLPSEFKSSGSDLLNLAKFAILPFGLNIQQILSVCFRYVAGLFWWLIIPAIAGIFIFLKKYHEKKQAVYFLIIFGVSLYLAVYYGSWVFADQLTLNLNKLGLSYVRYFLPIYILLLPLAAIFALSLINYLKNKLAKIIAVIGFAIIVIGFSLAALFINGEDNLVKINGYLSDYQAINQKVLAMTEVNSIIISQRSDKIFFPDRKVIGRWEVADFYDWAYLLDYGIPLYYYAYENQDFIGRLNDNLFEVDLELTGKKEITDKENLYKIDWLPYDEADFE